MRNAFATLSLAVVCALYMSCSSTVHTQSTQPDASAGGGSGGASGSAGSGGSTVGGSGGLAGSASGGTGASGGSAGSGGNAGAGGSAGADGGAGCPVGMVLGPTNDYCIDSTEVTRKAYGDWIATSPPTSGQPSVCSFNTDFAPTTTGECLNVTSLGPFVPQTCVDWCDAQAYCLAKGKRLCGLIGGDALPTGSLFDPNFAQWYSACSNQGTREHPYGSFQAGKCNDADAGIGTLDSVPAMSGACKGGVGNLYDMSGNAKEWIDSCTGNNGAGDQCFTLGGSYKSSGSTPLSCKGSSSASRNSGAFADLGFRCCVNL